MKYITDTTTNLNTNSVGATGNSITIKQTLKVAMMVIPKTGNHTTYVIGLQISSGGGIWATLPASEFSVPADVNNIASKAVPIVGRRVRPIVLTAEGAASKVDVIIMSK